MSSGDGFKFTFRFVSGGESMAIGIAMPLVCSMIVALRFYTRRAQKVWLGSDDWLILGALVWVIAMGVCFIYGAAKKVMGYPAPPNPPNLSEEELNAYISPQYELLEKIQFPFQIFMILAYGCVKMSIVAFYRRLFVVNKTSAFGIITLIVQTVVFLWSFTFLMIVIFPCGSHFSANWANTPTIEEYCPIGFTSEYGLVISDLILDCLIFLMPLPLIWNLRLVSKKKVAVSGILLLAATAVGASIARLVLYLQGISAVSAELSIDENQVLTVLLWWTLLECGLSLIAACLPTLSFLISYLDLQTVLGSFRSAFSFSSQRADASEQRARNLSDIEAPYADINSTQSATSSHTKVFRKSSGESQVHALQDL